jgi:hypothetical protein
VPHLLVEIDFLLGVRSATVRRALANCFFGAEAGGAAEGVVHAQDDALRVGDDDGVLRFERHCGDAQFFFCLLALGDVLNRADAPRRPAILVFQIAQAVHPAHRAVVDADDLVFVVKAQLTRAPP